LRTNLRTKADEVPETPFLWAFGQHGVVRILSPRFVIPASNESSAAKQHKAMLHGLTNAARAKYPAACCGVFDFDNVFGRFSAGSYAIWYIQIVCKRNRSNFYGYGHFVVSSMENTSNMGINLAACAADRYPGGKTTDLSDYTNLMSANIEKAGKECYNMHKLRRWKFKARYVRLISPVL